MNMNALEVARVIKSALECSVYAAPTDPGLTVEEVYEVGRRLGLKEGEIGDAFQLTKHSNTKDRLMPGPDVLPPGWIMSGIMDDSGCLKTAAFRHIHSEMSDAVGLHGARQARLDASLIIERGAKKGMQEHDIRVALTVSGLCGILREDEGLVRYADGRAGWGTVTQEPNSPSHLHVKPNVDKLRTLAVVRDVVLRRFDGRPKHAEPLDAFADQLDALGYAPFKMWWKQMVAELRHIDVQSTPVAATVVAAALVEGALTLVVRHARKLGLRGGFHYYPGLRKPDRAYGGPHSYLFSSDGESSVEQERPGADCAGDRLV